jgi:hypothetical protein
MQLFLQLSCDVGPQPLQPPIPLDSHFLIELINLLQQFYPLSSDFIASMINRPLHQQLQNLPKIDLPLLKIKLTQQFANDLLISFGTSSLDKTILGFCLSTGINFKLSSSLQILRH